MRTTDATAPLTKAQALVLTAVTARLQSVAQVADRLGTAPRATARRNVGMVLDNLTARRAVVREGNAYRLP